MLITGAVLLFVFLLLGSFHLTDLSRHFTKPVFQVAPDAVYTPAQAAAAISKSSEQIKDGFFNAGFTKQVWWVSVKPTVSDDSWIQIANPHINDIRIYEQLEGVWEEVYQSGDYYKYEQRILDDPDYWYPVKTGTHNYLIRVDKKGESLNIPLRLVKDRSLAAYLSERSFFHGMFIGWIILLLLLNLFLLASLREKIHLFYCLYVTFSAIWILSQWGMGFRYFWPDLPDFTSKSRPFFSNISYIFLLELTARFFTIPNTQRNYTKTIRAIQLLLLVSSIGLLLTDIPSSGPLLRYGYLTTMNIIWLAGLGIVLLFIWKGYKAQRELSLFFLIAFCFFGVYIVLLLLSQYHIGSDWMFFANMYGSPVGFLGESTILSFGLTQRYNFYKSEKEQAMQALEKERRTAADKIIQTQEEERNRLARELHDGLGGLLGGIRMGAHYRLKPYPAEQEWIAEQLDLAVNDLRNIAHDLMPVQLQEQGLDRVLEKAVSRWNMGEEFKVEYNSAIKNRYPLRTEAALYRIVLELMHNIKKHAAAKEVNIEIWEEEHTQRLTLLLEDNGKGFEPGKEEGIGWQSIRQHVQYMQGKINIDSSHLGTTVIIEILMEKETV
ncbi:sensor histidine kinase [Sediminibacterium goheungense]|uniref:histidine kinase n=1 Tax=Sediminibacterium goheungense TaxID=1086393 RepID=A0A4R6J2A6_9BACT|nr:7TM diverse intracellular signaling domain-containing protein [Sediminibacterium goheungense]TDO29409.1 signal transduction histidine kinase [Sediminibacterium goheungense]